MVSTFIFEELCVQIGGLVGDDRNCINTNKDKKIKSTKTVPYEYRDIHWYVNQYPKTLTNFSKICYELTSDIINDIGMCIPKTTEPPRQVSSIVIAITTKAPPPSLIVETTLLLKSIVETYLVKYAKTTKRLTKVFPLILFNWK